MGYLPLSPAVCALDRIGRSAGGLDAVSDARSFRSNASLRARLLCCLGRGTGGAIETEAYLRALHGRWGILPSGPSGGAPAREGVTDFRQHWRVATHGPACRR